MTMRPPTIGRSVTDNPALVEHVWETEDREYRRAFLMRPRSGRPQALVVELHGSGLDPERQYRASRLADLLWQEGWALLMPQAAIPFQLLPELDPGFAWNIPGAALPGEGSIRPSGPDDMAWIAALTVWYQEAIGATDVPLFLVGYSGGARLASHLVVHGDTDWRAAGLVAGLRHVPKGRVAPPPLIALHGMADTTNAYAGGDTPRWDVGVEETAALVAGARGCRSEPQCEAIGGGFRRVYRDNEGMVALEQYSLAGAGHAWMGSADPVHRVAFGPCGDDIDATQTIIAFFKARLSDDRIQTAITTRPAPDNGARPTGGGHSNRIGSLGVQRMVRHA